MYRVKNKSVINASHNSEGFALAASLRPDWCDSMLRRASKTIFHCTGNADSHFSEVTTSMSRLPWTSGGHNVCGFDRNLGPWNQAELVSSESLHPLETKSAGLHSAGTNPASLAKILECRIFGCCQRWKE